VYRYSTYLTCDNSNLSTLENYLLQGSQLSLVVVPIIPLNRVTRLEEVGGKSWTLALLQRAGMPIPRGFCVPVATMRELQAGKTLEDVEAALSDLYTPSVAVRSSALAEDGQRTSFAGVYRTELNVPANAHAVLLSLLRIAESANSDAASSYSRRVRISETGEMGALVQEMVYADVAGVLFTANPITKEKQFIIEASWGLGEYVVSGKVNADRYILTPGGELSHREIGAKKKKLVAQPNCLSEVPVSPPRDLEPSLNPEMLGNLVTVGAACEKLLGYSGDIEWAIEEDTLWITQCRPITTLLYVTPENAYPGDRYLCYIPL
jgi:phosphoenolpyruvate synthase/pyruvate phosphate dikinase